MSTIFKTIEHSRLLKATPQTVFHALGDRDLRCQWGTPTDEDILIFDKVDFRTGGIEISRCGSRESPEYTLDTYYLDVVQDARVVFAESVNKGELKLSASMVTMELTPKDKDCLLQVTIQAASFTGPDMLEGYEYGWGASLDGLVRLIDAMA